MSQVKISELKARLSAHVRAAEAGRVITIMDRSRAVARLGPISTHEPGLEVIPAMRPFKSVRNVRLPATTSKVDSLRALRAERGDR
jgi:antitoxin (DNA-binding transcriptional repressor) of toxin-antitoxin stability system